MKVLINSPDYKITKKRIEVEATLIRKFKTTFLCQLEDGNIILRKKNRDIPNGETLE